MTENRQRDIHILKYFSSFVTVLKGRVIYITDPLIEYCPLASRLYGDFKKIKKINKKTIKQAVKKIIEFKIEKYGFFTENRDFSDTGICVPYGTSEMLMYALRKCAIDAAVVVCDGAGTVIVNNPEVVQGIGARMNTLVSTSPIKETIERLEQLKCSVLSDSALIDQIRGIEKAAELGYKKIAVTITGSDAEQFAQIRSIEHKYGISVTALATCTTGISKEQKGFIKKYADVVWSCASAGIRSEIGPAAILQLSTQIPVFALTKKGLGFVSAYAKEPRIIKSMDVKKQYLVSARRSGKRVRMGNFSAFVSEACLPVSAGRVQNGGHI